MFSKTKIDLLCRYLISDMNNKFEYKRESEFPISRVIDLPVCINKPAIVIYHKRDKASDVLLNYPYLQKEAKDDFLKRLIMNCMCHAIINKYFYRDSEQEYLDKFKNKLEDIYNKYNIDYKPDYNYYSTDRYNFSRIKRLASMFSNYSDANFNIQIINPEFIDNTRSAEYLLKPRVG